MSKSGNAGYAGESVPRHAALRVSQYYEMIPMIQNALTMLHAEEWTPVTTVKAQFCVREQTMVESHASALFVATVEFACGAALGFAPLCAVAWLDGFLYLPEVLYALILVWLIFSGPGRYSLDGLIGWAGLFGAEHQGLLLVSFVSDWVRSVQGVEI